MREAFKEKQDLESVKTKQRELKVAVDTLLKFESFVLEHHVHYLEDTINNYLSQLIDIKCHISFINQGNLVTRSLDKFCLTLERNGSEYSYRQLSDGERVLVAYAFKIAINTLSFKDTFLFIDEGLNKLDQTNRQKLIQLLYSSPFNQIFVVSHDDSFTELPLIYIEKKNDESQVVQQP